MSGDSCASSIQDCVDYSDASTCSRCVNTFSLSGNACTAPASRLLESSSRVYAVANSGTLKHLPRQTSPGKNANASQIIAPVSPSIGVDSSSCGADEFLDGLSLECKERALVDPKCEEFSRFSDTCLRCASSHFLSYAFRCVAVPVGVPHCAEHSEASSAPFTLESRPPCVKCAAGFVLSADSQSCTRVAQPVANCLLQASESECGECASGFYLENNACLKSAVLNCKEPGPGGVCQRCEDFYVVVESEGSAPKCVYSRIEGCLEHDLSAPDSLSCRSCAAPFYLTDAGLCAKVDSPVALCKRHSSPSECAECAEGSFLSEDRRSCAAFAKSHFWSAKADKRCLKGRAQDSVCGVCRVGFFADLSGKCVACATENCAVCTREGKCLICLSGFYMDTQKQCQSSGVDSSRVVEMSAARAVGKVFWAALLFVLAAGNP